MSHSGDRVWVQCSSLITNSKTFCAKLLVQPEEIVLCMMSTQSDPQLLPYIWAFVLNNQLVILYGLYIFMHISWMQLQSCFVNNTSFKYKLIWQGDPWKCSTVCSWQEPTMHSSISITITTVLAPCLLCRNNKVSNNMKNWVDPTEFPSHALKKSNSQWEKELWDDQTFWHTDHCLGFLRTNLCDKKYRVHSHFSCLKQCFSKGKKQ